MLLPVRSRLPRLQRQKERRRPDRAFVVLGGRKVFCGRWGTDAARQRYDRAISEWLASGRRLPIPVDEQITVAVLTDRYWTHATGYYVHRDGSPTLEQRGIKQALRTLNQVYADTLAENFGPIN